MGVMSCYRNNCENIMCDIYISDIGYICYSCKHEFGEKKYKTEKKYFNEEYLEGVSLTDYLNRY